MNTVILVPVWPGYRWIAPLTRLTLDRYWPSHPEIWFCDGGEIDRDPPRRPSDTAARPNWTANLRDGVRGLCDRGVDAVYLVAEEHVPLAPCQETHLNETLPRLLDELPAVYISLLGWDNRRHTSRSPVLGPDRFRFKHLIQDRDPRFHLHPALWRIDVLEACCDLALRDTEKNGSAWHFEKVNDREASPHPAAWKHQAYQICAEAMTARPPSAGRRLAARVEQFVFHKLMAVYPWIRNASVANRFARAVGFDDFFNDGPYPMFFSGIMSKGRLNPLTMRFLERTRNPLLAEIKAAAAQAGVLDAPIRPS